jgi:hypothetical protein
MSVFGIGGLDLAGRIARIENALGISDDTTALSGNAIQISGSGVFHITKGSAAAYTLRAPISGLPQSGGEDGVVLRIISASAFAHVVTTPAGKLNGALHIGTFGAAIGNGFELHAKGGVWLVAFNTGVTLS